ncbi:MAG: HD domain-containing protein [Desulfopila sp.]
MTHHVPSISTCLHMMEKHSMLDNIRGHSLVVARVAERIRQRLDSRPALPPLPAKSLIIAGALLHDIAKTQCLREGCDHAKVGAAICMADGYPEIADIVREHVRLFDFAVNRYSKGQFLAKELIFYADKRVVHTNIASLDQRLEYILEKYGDNTPVRHELIRKNFNQCRELERWLCHHGGCSADELALGIAGIHPASLLPQSLVEDAK